MYVLSKKADDNRITVAFVLAGAALMVPRNRSNQQTAGATGSFSDVPGMKGWRLTPRSLNVGSVTRVINIFGSFRPRLWVDRNQDGRNGVISRIQINM